MGEVKGVCMTDKTAIDALKKICSIETGTWDNPVPFSKLYHEAKGIAIEALAAIESEKPGEDETDFERSLLELSREPDKAYIYLGYIKKQFAESYHAKQCKACSKWISVKDRLPESSTPLEIIDVWAYYRHDFPNSEWRQGKCKYYGKFDFWQSSENSSGIEVTHWQPLPEAPK